MKKIFFLFWVIWCYGSGNAQDLTFEQTVSYIRKNVTGRVLYPGDLDAYSRTKGYVVAEIGIGKNGSVKIKTENKNDINDYTIEFNIFDLVQKTDYPGGVKAYRFLVHFNGLNVSSGYGISFATDADAERMARAFRYLRKVCQKDPNPFDKPGTAENSGKQTKEETLHYLSSKADEANGEADPFMGSNEKPVKLFNVSFTGSGKMVKYAYSTNIGGSEWKTEFEFNPADLEEASFNKYQDKNKIVLILNVYIKDQRAFVKKGNGQRTKTREVYFLFVYRNPEDPIRIIKALEHLRDLYSDEKDPFDN